MMFSADKVGTIKNTNKIVLFLNYDNPRKKCFVSVDSDKSDEFVKDKVKQNKKNNILSVFTSVSSVLAGGLTYALVRLRQAGKCLSAIAVTFLGLAGSHKLFNKYESTKAKEIADKFDVKYLDYLADMGLSPDFLPDDKKFMH